MAPEREQHRQGADLLTGTTLFRPSRFFGLSRIQRSVKVGCSRAAVDQEISAGDECTSAAHQQFCHIGHFIGRSRALGGTLRKHAFVKVSARTVELIQRQRRHDDARGDRIDARAALAPLHRFRHDPLYIAAFGQLISVQRIADVLRLQDIQGKQLFRRRACQQFILLRAQRRHAVSRLTGDMHADASRRDHLPRFLQQYRCSIQVHLQDRLDRRLARRYPGGIHQHRDRTMLLRLSDERLLAKWMHLYLQMYIHQLIVCLL